MRKLTAPPAIALSLAVAPPVHAAGVSVNGSRVLPHRGKPTHSAQNARASYPDRMTSSPTNCRAPAVRRRAAPTYPQQ
jgi:hypothetical protein